MYPQRFAIASPLHNYTFSSLSLSLSFSLSLPSMGRPPCCDKSNVKRGLWTPEEDAKILAYVSNNGIGNWTLVPQKAGLNRCGKSCRLRWTNYLRPDLKHDGFTPQEEDLIINLHKAIGSRWSHIAKQLPGRTDNDVKNYWNTKLRKKLFKLGIDPVTHKPFSQILSDCRDISGFQNSQNQIGSLNKNMKYYASVSTPEPSSVLTVFPNTDMIRNKPVMEQVQDSCSNVNIHSWHCLSQFQVLDPEIIQPHFFNEATSSCSSTSSSNVTQLGSPQSYSCQPSHAQMTPSSSFNWNEFLSEPLPYLGFQQQQDRHLKGVLSPNNCPSTLEQTSQLNLATGNYNGLNRIGHEGGFGTFDFGSTSGGQTNNRSEASSSVSSFVDAILEQDSEMRAEFPDILDGSFDY